MLAVPHIKTHFSYCSLAFSNAAPQLCNALPLSLKNASNIETFKRQLKTYFFDKSYNHLNKLNESASELYKT